jgi:hypothetical protein
VDSYSREMLRKEAQIKDLQSRLENGEGSEYRLGGRVTTAVAGLPPLYETKGIKLCTSATISLSFFFPQPSFFFCPPVPISLSSRDASADGNGVRVSQLYNARGKKLADPSTVADQNGVRDYNKRKSLVGGTKQATSTASKGLGGKKEQQQPPLRSRALSPSRVGSDSNLKSQRVHPTAATANNQQQPDASKKLFRRIFQR